jgi:hypothetical protein
MSIVPKEVVRDIRETWPARDMPLLEYAAERGAQWALGKAAELCDEYGASDGHICADEIRALIKGGESDGQG